MKPWISTRSCAGYESAPSLLARLRAHAWLAGALLAMTLPVVAEAASPCGDVGQRACCVVERVPSCNQGLHEVAGCTGNCACGPASVALDILTAGATAALPKFSLGHCEVNVHGSAPVNGGGPVTPHPAGPVVVVNGGNPGGTAPGGTGPVYVPPRPGTAVPPPGSGYVPPPSGPVTSPPPPASGYVPPPAPGHVPPPPNPGYVPPPSPGTTTPPTPSRAGADPQCTQMDQSIDQAQAALNLEYLHLLQQLQQNQAKAAQLEQQRAQVNQQCVLQRR